MNKASFRQKIVLIIFGLCLCAVLLELGLRLGGFIFLSLQEYKNRISLKQKGTYRILCLGESTTAGQWPGPLEDALNQKDIGIRFSVIDKGIPGTNTGVILSQLEDNLDKYNPQMVITMMGINDRKYILPYEDIPAKKAILFFRSFRTYKLIRLLRLHIINKAREIGVYRPRDKKENTNDSTKLGSFLNQQEEILKKVIEIDPENEQGYFRLGRYYRKIGEHNKSEEMFKKAIEIDPENEKCYFRLGRYYRKIGEHNKSGGMFKKAIEMNPENEEGYLGLGKYYRDKGEYNKAEEMFKKAIEIDPENEEGYLQLGRYYRDKGGHNKAEEMFKKAIEIDPENEWGYLGLGKYYIEKGELDKAEEMFKKTIEIDPVNEWGYLQLGKYYRDKGEHNKSGGMFKKAIEIDPENDKLIAALAVFYMEKGEYTLAEECSKKAESLRTGHYNPATHHNYQRLKEIVTEGGIRLVCVQYPMRNIELLKRMFKEKEGSIFVDNEKLFKEVVGKEGHDEYFTDLFAGNFGHCTPKGNRLLAENIANRILKEYF